MTEFHCAVCGQVHQAGSAWRVTLVSEHFDLRGEFLGDITHLRLWANAQRDFGVVAASPLEETDD